MWRAYTSLIDADTRTAFLHTLRSVVDTKGQRVSARDRLYLAHEVPTLIIWGEDDPIIPVSHAYEAPEAMPDSRLEVMAGPGLAMGNDPFRRFRSFRSTFVASR